MDRELNIYSYWFKTKNIQGGNNKMLAIVVMNKSDEVDINIRTFLVQASYNCEFICHRIQNFKQAII